MTRCWPGLKPLFCLGLVPSPEGRGFSRSLADARRVLHDSCLPKSRHGASVGKLEGVDNGSNGNRN